INTQRHRAPEVSGNRSVAPDAASIRPAQQPRSVPRGNPPDVFDEGPRLTPRDPQDEPPAQRLWKDATNHDHNLALHDFEWAWITPFRTPLRISNFYLTYDKSSPVYEKLMPPHVPAILQWWREDQIRKGKARKLARLDKEPLGLQVRLV